MRSVFLTFVLAASAASCLAKTPTDDGNASGGSKSNGGATSSGGVVSSGGVKSSGGTTASSGGTTSSGGTSSTGGTSGPPPSVDCTDTSSFTSLINQQYGGTYISVNDSKNYYMQSNWWGSPYNGQTENVNGLGFSVANPNNVVTSNKDLPLGFPSIFIGAYGGKTTKGSNLPKQVSALTSVPTIFNTNVDQKGSASYNAAYDVWLTAGSAPLGSGQSTPGSGGAYLMVWLFKPTDKQPRGTLKNNGRIIDGVSGGWDVWYDNTNPPCVSYVANPKISSLSFDLNAFIQDAVKNNYGVTSSQYLSIVFAGFEIWGGGDGVQVKQFCANVK